jgi:hypothetical protein
MYVSNSLCFVPESTLFIGFFFFTFLLCIIEYTTRSVENGKVDRKGDNQIHKAKAEKQREKILKEEMDAKRAKTKAARERRQERITAKRNALAGEDEDKKD